MIYLEAFLFAVLAAVMIMSVSACSGAERNNDTDNKSETVQTSVSDESPDAGESIQESVSDTASAKDLKSIYEQAKSELGLPEEMIDITAKRLDRVMGITEDEMEEFAGSISSDGVTQDQIIYIKAKDESKVEDIKNKLQSNLDSIYAVVQNYDPKQKENIEKAKVETNGLYVSLVISADSERIRSIIEKNLW